MLPAPDQSASPKNKAAYLASANDQAIKLPSKYSHAAITGTWDGARKWSEGAATCERLKLFCQVMTGFELIAIKAINGHTHGSNQHSRTPHAAESSLTWEERVKKEIGISPDTAGRFILMAGACASKLKRLPALKDFDPTAAPLATLNSELCTSLKTAVKKLTDGRTQKEFGESLGLWKKPAGTNAGRKPGDGGRPAGPSTPEAARAARIKMAREDVGLAAKSIDTLGHKWIVLEETDDLALNALREACALQTKALTQWLNMPAANRDPKAIEKLFK